MPQHGPVDSEPSRAPRDFESGMQLNKEAEMKIFFAAIVLLGTLALSACGTVRDTAIGAGIGAAGGAAGGAVATGGPGAGPGAAIGAAAGAAGGFVYSLLP